VAHHRPAAARVKARPPALRQVIDRRVATAIAARAVTAARAASRITK